MVIALIPFILIIIVLTALISFLFKRKINNKVYRILTSLMLAVILYFTLSYSFLSYFLKPSNIAFEANKWKEDTTIRYQMINSLIDLKEEKLLKQDTTSVEELIGLPTDKDSLKWSYEIIGRTWSDFTVQTLVLEIEGSSVSKVYLKRD